MKRFKGFYCPTRRAQFIYTWGASQVYKGHSRMFSMMLPAGHHLEIINQIVLPVPIYVMDYKPIQIAEDIFHNPPVVPLRPFTSNMYCYVSHAIYREVISVMLPQRSRPS